MIETILTPEYIERYTRSGDWGQRIWPDFIAQTARAAPDRPAIVDSAGTITYREFDDMLDRLALGLLRFGIAKEDSVGLQMPNWREFLLLRFALAKIGAIAVPLPIDWRQKEVRDVLAATEAVAVLVPLTHHHRNYVAEMRELQIACPHIRTIIVARSGDALPAGCTHFERLLSAGEVSHGRDELARMRPGANEVDLVVTTSGSTAAPKMIVRTPNCFIATARQFADHRGRFGGDDVVAAIAPIARGMGYYIGVAAAILRGSTMALLERFSPEAALAWLERTRASVAVAVPTQLVKMLEVPDLARYDLGRLRILVNGGAPIAPAIAEAVERKLGCVLLTAYGSVEGATPTATAPEDPPQKRYRTVGRVMPGMELRVVGEDGRDLPAGSAGEVVYRGPGLSLGFWRNASGYRRQLGAEGWFPSGDLGVLDDEGYLSIVGRIKEIIIRGGINISPSEVEGLLQEHADVAAVCVVKMPDPVLGERCCAFVVPANGKQVTVEELARFLAGRGVAKYKFPERVELRSALPLTPDGGKVMRKALEDEIAAIVAREAGGSN